MRECGSENVVIVIINIIHITSFNYPIFNIALPHYRGNIGKGQDPAGASLSRPGCRQDCRLVGDMDLVGVAPHRDAQPVVDFIIKSTK